MELGGLRIHGALTGDKVDLSDLLQEILAESALMHPIPKNDSSPLKSSQSFYNIFFQNYLLSKSFKGTVQVMILPIEEIFHEMCL